MLNRLQARVSRDRISLIFPIVALCLITYLAIAIALIYEIPPYFLFLIPLLLVILVPGKAVIVLLLFLVATSAWLPWSSWDFSMASIQPYLLEWIGGWRNVLVGPALAMVPIIGFWLLCLFGKEFRLFRSPLVLLFALFIGANLLSAAWNFQAGVAELRHLVGAITLYVLYATILLIVASIVAEPKRDGRLIALGLLGAGVVAVIGTASVVGVSFWQLGENFWKTNPIYTANLWMGGLGGFGCIGALVAIAGMLETRNRALKLPLLLVALASVSIVLLAWQRTFW